MKKFPFGKYYHVDGKTTRLFDTSTCEHCGRMTMAGNSVGGCVGDIPKYIRMGMIEWITRVPPEMYYSEELGSCACDECNG